jgi:hypothetical protein
VTSPVSEAATAATIAQILIRSTDMNAPRGRAATLGASLTRSIVEKRRVRVCRPSPRISVACAGTEVSVQPTANRATEGWRATPPLLP